MNTGLVYRGASLFTGAAFRLQLLPKIKCNSKVFISVTVTVTEIFLLTVTITNWKKSVT